MNEPLVLTEIRRLHQRLRYLSESKTPRREKVRDRYWELFDLMGYLPEDLRSKAWILGMEKGW